MRKKALFLWRDAQILEKQRLVIGWKEREWRYGQGSQWMKGRTWMIQLLLPENTAISSPPEMKGLQISVKIWYLFLHHFSCFQGPVQYSELNTFPWFRTYILLPETETPSQLREGVEHLLRDKHKDRPTSRSSFPNWTKGEMKEIWGTRRRYPPKPGTGQHSFLSWLMGRKTKGKANTWELRPSSQHGLLGLTLRWNRNVAGSYAETTEMRREELRASQQEAMVGTCPWNWRWTGQPYYVLKQHWSQDLFHSGNYAWDD